MIDTMKIRTSQIFSDQVVDCLKAERLRQGISQYKLAKECDIGKSTVNYIENHTRKPTFYMLAIIAAYLKVNLSDIIRKVERENGTYLED